MANKVEIIIDAVDQATKDIQNVQKSLGGMEKSAKGASISFTEINSAMQIAAQVAQMVGQAINETVGFTVEYAKQVRDLSRDIGATAEQSSALIQAADDVGVSFETVQAAMRAAVRKGVDPTIEGIGALADQYKELAPGVDRTRFLMEKFGRAGAELGPLMELGADGMKAAADEAEKLGLILGGDAVKQAREYEIALDDLNDRADALKITIGKELVPELTRMIDDLLDLDQAFKKVEDDEPLKNIGVNAGMSKTQIERLKKEYAEMNVNFADGVRIMKEMPVEETAANMNGLAEAEAAAAFQMGELKAATSALLDKTWDNYTKRAGELQEENAQLQAEMQTLVSEGVLPTDEAFLNLAGRLDENKTKQIELKNATEEATNKLIYQTAISGLDADAQMVLAEKMGLVSEADKAMYDVIAAQKANLENGIITAEQYAGRINDIADAINSLKDKQITVTVQTIREEVTLQKYGFTPGERQEYRAGGGSVSAGMPYIVGERGREMFVPAQDGTIVPNGKLGAGGVTVVVNYQPLVSLADQREAQEKLAPLIQGALRTYGLNTRVQ